MIKLKYTSTSRVVNSIMNSSIFSFFAGCGILDLGFEQAGFDVVLVNEYSESFMNAYKYSREKMKTDKPKYGYAQLDVNEFLSEKSDEIYSMIKSEKEKGRLIGFIGGPPCPDFSIAGKQRGRNGDNGKLSQSYIDLIIKFQPDFFLFENVKGLWKTARHRLFYDELKDSLKKHGYCLTDRLTNALEFGVPQDRERILLIGVLKTKLKPEYYDENNNISSFPWMKYALFNINNVKQLPWPDQDPFCIDSKSTKPRGIPRELTAEYWFTKNKVENHPDGIRYFTPKAGLKKMLEIPEGDTNKKSYKRIHRWRYSPTVAYGNNEVHLHPYKARRLSVAESMALQSLPKEFSLPPEMTLTDCFKTIGNGVPFLLSYGIAKSINDFINETIKK